MKVSIALSGGGIRALAHLGVVKVLLDHGFEIGAVAGSSAGAIVGALFCSGKSCGEIIDIVKGLHTFDLAGMSEGGGVFGLKKIENILRDSLEAKSIESLSIPFVAACTDLESGCIRYFDRGDCARLCIASSSLVPIFSPVEYDGMILCDGGFMDNMPVKPLISFGYPILGINVNPIEKMRPKGIVATTVRAMMLTMSVNIQTSREIVDIYLEPKGCEKISIFDLGKWEDAYHIGIEEGRRRIGEIEKSLQNIY